MALNLSNIDFAQIVTDLTGHQSSAGLVGAVGSLVVGQVASGIIANAVKGGALNVVDPLGLATHLAGGAAIPSASLTGSTAALAAPAASSAPTLPIAIFITLNANQQNAFVAAGGQVKG